MGSPNQVTGLVYIYVDGKLLKSKEGAKLTNITGVSRAAVTGHRVYGFSQKVEVPTVECKLADTADLSLAELGAISDSTVTFETDTGKRYILRNAWCSNAIDLTGGEGDVDVTFMAMACEEDK